MKKRIWAALLAAVMLLTAVPVMASEPNEDDTSVIGEQKLDDIKNAGSTAVEADVRDENGEISYIIAIPEKIDFGTLQRPADISTAHPKQVGFEVSAVEIIGLDTSTQRVAVLMQDANASDKSLFIITGASGTNTDKILKYNVLSSVGTDITTGFKYPNGYLYAAFSQAGQVVPGTLSLDQNQLSDNTDIATWAGEFLGTINFYTAIAEIKDYV